MRCSVVLIFVSFVGLLIRQKALAELLEPQCGITAVTDRIKGGTDAKHGAFPWMAYLYLNENQFVCGGSLIHRRFVMTAAHCIKEEAYLSVRLGEYFTESRADSSTVYEVTMAIRNRLYETVEHTNDIGLLRLDREVQFNAYIRPVCILMDAYRLPQMRNYKVSGWGTTAYSRTSSVLQMLELQDSDPSKCYELTRIQPGPGEICATNPNGDTCLGDSGGPLVQRVNVEGTTRFIQFGIVSYGFPGCTGPAVYTRVHYYVDWIQRVVQYGLSH